MWAGHTLASPTPLASYGFATCHWTEPPNFSEPQFSSIKWGKRSLPLGVDLRILVDNVCNCPWQDAWHVEFQFPFFLFLPIIPFAHKGKSQLPRRPLRPFQKGHFWFYCIALWMRALSPRNVLDNGLPKYSFLDGGSGGALRVMMAIHVLRYV